MHSSVSGSVLSNTTYRRLLQMSFFGFVLIFALWQTRIIATDTAYRALSQQNMNELFRYSSALSSVLQKYESVPQQLSLNENIHSLLQNVSDPQLIDEVNRYLEIVNDIHGSSDIYIMDSLGNTIAASNWKRKKTFIGKNFSFRPYYTQAIQGKQGKYYALGTTSNRRGYYFSVPVSDDDDILGIVVLKISLANIEERWASPWSENDIELIVTDANNVVFISTQPDWRLKSLGKISAPKMADLRRSRRYGNHIPTHIDARSVHYVSGYNGQQAQVISIGEPGTTGVTYLSQVLEMPFAGWKVQALSKTDSVKEAVKLSLIIVIAIYVFLVLVFLFVKERLRNERQLQQSKELLEDRVRERTQDLETSNVRLRSEVDERLKAEAALKRTQEELIQAAKMAALGQISAGINHELNQPLTAIRSYTQNTQQFLARGNIDTAQNNLTEVIKLTDHMTSIIAQLKVFSRKRDESLTSVDVMSCLQEAIKIMSPQIKQQDVQVSLHHQQQGFWVLGDLIRLEQVFINLLANACQAMAHKNTKTIHIFITLDNTQPETPIIQLRFEDTGSGIDQDKLKRIFDPFFTTKDISQGLGLGLSISHRIIDAMQGTLTAENRIDGGACFTIRLPALISEHDQSNSHPRVDSVPNPVEAVS